MSADVIDISGRAEGRSVMRRGAGEDGSSPVASSAPELLAALVLTGLRKFADPEHDGKAAAAFVLRHAVYLYAAVTTPAEAQRTAIRAYVECLAPPPGPEAA